MSKKSRIVAAALRAIGATRRALTLAALGVGWLAAGLPFAAQAQTPAPANATRPKVCLVLSGGGARGAAHVGVLKVLEELRVPVDCIVGTSMGSIVGAAYASGRSVAALERAMAALNSDALFVDEPPRHERPLRRKADDERDYVGPELGASLSRGLMLPKGAVGGTALEAVLRGLMQSHAPLAFDALPTPFRAIATDVTTGDLVVFSRGSLPLAVRASMSVPGLVAPTEVDGRLLVDGGLVRNLPVDVARAMGAEVVIAVNLGTPLMKRDQITSALSVSSQMLNILTEQNVQASLKQLTARDVLVSPQLGDASATDFASMSRLVPLGELAARAVADALRQWGVSEASYARWTQARGASMARAEAQAKAAGPLAEVRIVGTQRVNPEAILAALHTRPGEPLDKAVIDADLRRLYGWGDFEALSYATSERDDGLLVVTVDVREKTWGPNYLRMGLGLQAQLGGNSSFDLLLSLRRTWMNALGAEWRSELQMGHVGLLSTEWHQPFTTNRVWFGAAGARLVRAPVNVFEGDQQVAQFTTQTLAASLDLGVNLNPSTELRVGLDRGRLRVDESVGNTGLASGQRVSLAAARVQLHMDTRDAGHFAREGARVALDVRAGVPALGAASRYVRWQVAGRQAWADGASVYSLAGAAGGAFDTGGADALPVHEYFTLGGPLTLSAYPTGRFVGPSFRHASLSYARRVVETPMLRGAYLGLRLDAGRIGASNLATDAQRTLTSAGLFLGLDSPLGPLYFGVGFAPGGQRAASIWLGPPR